MPERDSSNDPKVQAIILAAGTSSRLGQPKQLVPYRGTTLLTYTLEQVMGANFAEVFVVLGANFPQISSSILSHEKIASRTKILNNSDFASGISTSIRCGIDSAPEHCDAAAIILCDQPALSTMHLNNLLREFSRDKKSGPFDSRIAASFYDGNFGVPAIFGRKFFPNLMGLSGDQGAKKILKKEMEIVIGVPFPEGQLDIDTPQDIIAIETQT